MRKSTTRTKRSTNRMTVKAAEAARVWFNRQTAIMASAGSCQALKDYTGLTQSAAARDLFIRQLFAMAVVVEDYQFPFEVASAPRNTAALFANLLAAGGHV